MGNSIIQRLIGLFRKPQAEKQHLPTQGLTTEEIADYVRREVVAGFLSRADIEQLVTDVFRDDMDEPQLTQLVHVTLNEAMAERRRIQQSWPAITDCDRLDAAFMSLEEDGILARQNYSCCGTCGAAEIWDELTNARDEGKAVRGYVFYHVQDTENAADGGGLYLNYGALEEGENAALAIAGEIVGAMERSGLSTNWNGSWNQRIGVQLDWKRRSAV